MKKFVKILLYAGLVVLAVIILFFIYFNLPVKTPDKNFELGVTYSARYAADIGLDKKETLAAIFDELGVRKIRIPAYWDLTEPENDHYDFSEIDWQLEEAKKRNAEVVLVVGEKVPRWPECFKPGWINDGDSENKNRELLSYIIQIIKRYKDNPAIVYWQVENEPYLPFGICPGYDSDIVDQEIALVKLLDPGRKIIITDSGELSLWMQAARRADIFGTTLYRSVVTEKFGGLAFDYPIGPNFFRFKHWLANTLVGKKDIIIVELQGEPWLRGRTTDQPLEEQLKAMDAEKLQKNVEFAKKTGFSPIYIWGAEWWYWLKTEKGYPQAWDKAGVLFREK